MKAVDNAIAEPNLEAVRCPQCAGKDAEIARLNAPVETEIKCRSDLVSELAWIKSERPAVAKTERDLREEIERLAQEIITWRNSSKNWMTIFSERDTWKSLSNTATKERDELKAKLEKAKEALKKYAGGRSQQWRIVDNGEEAREAMKQIGE